MGSAQSYLTLCDPMDRSTPGLPVHHHLPKFTQTHVHWVGDAIQASYPVSSPPPPALHLSQHQGLFKWVSSLYQVTKVLEFKLQHQSIQWIFRTDCSSHGVYQQWFLISGRPKSIMHMVIFTLLVPFQFFPFKNQPTSSNKRNPLFSSYPLICHPTPYSLSCFCTGHIYSLQFYTNLHSRSLSPLCSFSFWIIPFSVSCDLASIPCSDSCCPGYTFFFQ